jgi:ABC-type amino acid transport system permease subunit
MIFIDYIYYFFCNLYKLSKREQHLDSWKISGAVVSGISLCLFGMAVMDIVDMICRTNYLMFFSTPVIFLICLIFFGIRYKKYTNYEEAAVRLKALSPGKQTILSILLVIYFLFTISVFVYVIYTGYYISFNKT